MIIISPPQNIAPPSQCIRLYTPNNRIPAIQSTIRPIHSLPMHRLFTIRPRGHTRYQHIDRRHIRPINILFPLIYLRVRPINIRPTTTSFKIIGTYRTTRFTGFIINIDRFSVPQITNYYNFHLYRQRSFNIRFKRFTKRRIP